ncbi:MAG TPA: N-6 DNA methylase [Blastocatellia bacterium]|nr:N-6 DNA methylase [Blastocatellia bacterium]
MLTDPVLRSQIDRLWDKLWTGGLSNPLDAIEQLSYLLFMKRLDEEDLKNEQAARRRNQEYQSAFSDVTLRWSDWTKRTADAALKHVKEKVFPALRELGAQGSSFQEYMQNAEFKINKPSLLIEACKLIDEMKISEQNQDVQGDLYEYLLNKLNTAGRNGQFRTPRHIIRMMVQMLAPKAGERICDPAAGTCGFLVNAYQYILETKTSKDALEYDEDGMPHHLTGDLLTPQEREFLRTRAITGYDNDSGMTMLRIGSMNLMLHGLTHPRFHYSDTLSKGFNEEKQYDVVLANPPFKGAIDSADVNPSLPTRYKKTELLFLHLFLRLLDMGGRCAAIVPDGVLFGSSNAHIETRKKIIEENRLEAVVSMPSGVFKPYAGVSTAVLIFTRGDKTNRIWFYDMEHDGYSLDDKRQKVEENDIPDVLLCWRHRNDEDFASKRAERLTELRTQIAPLKAERLTMLKEINRLTFENAIAPDGDEQARQALEADQQKLAQLEEQIAPLQKEINQLTRKFWVTKEQVKANKYDLSASRYRQIEQDEAFYEDPQITLERLFKLDMVMADETKSLRELL